MCDDTETYKTLEIIRATNSCQVLCFLRFVKAAYLREMK